MSTPNPVQVYMKFKDVLRRDVAPSTLLYQFLSSGTKEANYIANMMIDNRDALILLTTPEGRKWAHRWIDDFLNYLDTYAKNASK
jgi:hypothetical protein